MKDLKNKTVFITSATADIGKACAIVFADAGANLLIAARRIERLNELAKEIKQKFDTEVKTIKLDVRNSKDVKNKFSALDERWQNIDILVNNAGLARGFDKIYEGKIDDWEEMIDTNIKGLL